MAYLGQSNSLYDPTRVTPTTVQTFNGNGVTTQFTLQYSVQQSTDIQVLVENVVQQPDYAYTAIGNVITFSSAPPVGTNNIYISFGKVTGLTGTVPDGSVTSSKLANNIRLLATDMYTGTGSQSTFNLSDTPADANSLIVSVNGIEQAAPRNYTVSGSTITFTSAPDAGANVVIRNVGFRTTQTLFAFPSGTQMVQPVITGGSANNLSIGTLTGNLSIDGSGNVGIGTSSPAYKLEVLGYSRFYSSIIAPASGTSAAILTLSNSGGPIGFGIEGSAGGAIAAGSSPYATVLASNASQKIQVAPSGTVCATFDSSGNLGLGVTPSSWGSTFKAVELGTIGNFLTGYVGAARTELGTNAYYNGSAWTYANTAAATRFTQISGEHRWYNAPSGTAGNTISFTQAMTLDASGNLLLNTASQFGKVSIQVDGTTTPTTGPNVSPSSLNLYAFANGGSTDCTTGVFGWFTSTPGIGSGIGFSRENSGNWGTQIRFYTHPTTTSNISDITERARIDSSGNFLVGTTSVSGTEKLSVSTTSDKVAFFNQSVNTNAYNGIHVQIGSSQNNTSSYHFKGETRGYSNWYLYGNGTTSYSSDQRQKKDIETTRDGYLEDVAKLRVVKYRWLNQDEATPKELGLIAQEVEQVFPGLVQDHELEGVEGTRKVIKHSVMEFILIKAIQELSAKVDAQQAEIDKLKGTN